MPRGLTKAQSEPFSISGMMTRSGRIFLSEIHRFAHTLWNGSNTCRARASPIVLLDSEPTTEQPGRSCLAGPVLGESSRSTEIPVPVAAAPARYSAKTQRDGSPAQGLQSRRTVASHLGNVGAFRFVEGSLQSARDGPNGFGCSFKPGGNTIRPLFRLIAGPSEHPRYN